jgi:hypothetical protein
MEALESKEKMEEAVDGEHKSRNRWIALVIAVLAALLALTETAGKSAQTEALSANIKATDLWAFFQSKSSRMTTLRTAAESASLSLLNEQSPGSKAVIQKQIDAWKATADRYDSEPETREGRKELTERAMEAEAERDQKLAAYHLFELASASFQLAIVLASAAIITSLVLFVYCAIGLGVLGTVLSAIAWLAPTSLYL